MKKTYIIIVLAITTLISITIAFIAVSSNRNDFLDGREVGMTEAYEDMVETASNTINLAQQIITAMNAMPIPTENPTDDYAFIDDESRWID